jgi:hypothetical protein
MARTRVRFEMSINKDGKTIKYYPIVSFRDDARTPLKTRIEEHIRSVEKNEDYVIDGYMVEGGEVWQRNA